MKKVGSTGRLTRLVFAPDIFSTVHNVRKETRSISLNDTNQCPYRTVQYLQYDPMTSRRIKWCYKHLNCMN